MRPYKDINGDSGVSYFDYGESWIEVKFTRTDRVYRYSHEIAGKEHVDEMKKLADAGDGLNSYINRNVKHLYDR
ncbi:MAG: hypothetical protein KF874_02150 [Rhizobiaceae bacterium]|nr:hypothetical protein [Rhizobiaceae bacterium]